MFKSTIKKSNIINSLLYTQTNSKALLNKINFENNQKNQKTFLIDDTKKRLIPKLKEEKRLYYTKSEINFKQKYNSNNNINNDLIEKKSLKNTNNDFHSIKKENCLQKLKDMIFSPGDVNSPGKEFKENGGIYYNNTIKFSKNNNIKQNNSLSTMINLLPNKSDNKKTLVLDLDETLIHSAFEPFNPKDDITLTMKMKDNDIIIHVLKRPYLDEFLNIVTQKYEVVIFTASISDYANPLLDQLDPMKKISHRLFREHCTKTDNGLFIKDLNRLGRDLKNVIIIDNNPVSFIANKANGLPILTWHSIQSDNELIKLIPLLTYLSNVDDIRPIINKVVNGYYINYKEVNKIISNNDTTYNNCSSLNNNSKEDDYFNNWFTSNMKLVEKKNSFKYSNVKDKKNKIELSNDKNNIDENSKMNTIQRKESFDQLIKYKGLLGSKEEFNFDNYKNSRHTKLFSGFLFNNNDNGKINNENNNGNITKKSFFMDLDEKDKKDYNKNSKNDDYDLKFNSRLDKKRNHSSKNLINIRKNINKDNDINFYNNNKLKKEKSSDKFKDISLTKYNIDNCNNSKLNKTDANINLNDSIKKNINYKNFVMNNNKNIINNNIYLINNNQSNINNENNKTIEYSNRYIFNDEVNKSFKDAYKSANSFYNKKDRSQSYEYKKKQINHNNDLSKLLDKLINYNKENKNLNINSNQLISISDNSKLLINQKIPFNQKINYLMINNNEKSLNDKKNDLLLRINNKSKNYNYYGSYKSSSNNIYVDTGNNSENYINKNIKKSFLYEDNLKNKKINNEYNNYKLIKHKTNIENNKTIKYLSPTSNFKVNLYK